MPRHAIPCRPMPCRTARTRRRRLCESVLGWEEHVAVDAVWGPIPSENGPPLARGGAVQGQVPPRGKETMANSVTALCRGCQWTGGLAAQGRVRRSETGLFEIRQCSCLTRRLVETRRAAAGCDLAASVSFLLGCWVGCVEGGAVGQPRRIPGDCPDAAEDMPEQEPPTHHARLPSRLPIAHPPHCQ